MNNRNNDSEFNNYLKEQADKFKMYPSDNVWSAIRNELHGERKWPALTVLSLLIILALTISTVIYDKPILFNNEIIIASAKAPVNNAGLDNYLHINQTNTSSTTSSVKVAVNKSVNSGINDVKNSVTISNAEVVPDFNNALSTTNNDNSITTAHDGLFTKASYATINNQLNANSLLSSKLETLIKPGLQNEELKNNITLPSLNAISLPVLNNNKSSRWSWQVYVTPSSSYRKLYDDNTRKILEARMANNNQNSLIPFAAASKLDVNDFVKHRSALGLEAGFGLNYKISNQLSFKTGLQFNLRRYYIDSYKSGVGIASIAVVRGDRVDTINQFSTASVSNGFASTQLKNKMYQVSVPLGLEWNIWSKGKFGINVAASVQPTYTLNQNVYLISTDYKFYTDGTSFLRQWNINSAIELNINYKLDSKTSIFLGPQMRYQHLPTYHDDYPIKEYRLDYGIKLGIMQSF